MSAALPRVAVLGYGRFGQAFVELLLRAGHPVQVFDPHATVPAELAAPSLVAATADASWIVLAMPVPQLRAALLALRPLLHAGQTVFDVGSVKLHPCALMDERYLAPPSTVLLVQQRNKSRQTADKHR